MSLRSVFSALTAAACLCFGGCSGPQPASTQAAQLGASEAGARAAPSPDAQTPAAQPAAPAPGPVVRQSYRIVRQTPHDPKAFTQGLFFHAGLLFESTGRYGESQVRKLDPETGATLAEADLPDRIFGEGSALWDGQMIVLSWKSGAGFVIDPDTLETIEGFSYPGEGWGLTATDTQLIQSNGSDQLLFLNPETYLIEQRLRVTLNGKPLRNLNELEWIEGEVWANIWQADQIVRIDPQTGFVTAVIDLVDLFPLTERAVPLDDVLNGIAYDPVGKRIFVTGKHWPTLFEIEITDPQ